MNNSNISTRQGGNKFHDVLASMSESKKFDVSTLETQRLGRARFAAALIIAVTSKVPEPKHLALVHGNLQIISDMFDLATNIDALNRLANIQARVDGTGIGLDLDEHALPAHLSIRKFLQTLGTDNDPMKDVSFVGIDGDTTKVAFDFACDLVAETTFPDDKIDDLLTMLDTQARRLGYDVDNIHYVKAMNSLERQLDAITAPAKLVENGQSDDKVGAYAQQRDVGASAESVAAE